MNKLPTRFSKIGRVILVAAPLFAPALFAQNVRVPVVLLNGYQATCSGTSASSETFGSMQSLLVADGWQVSFFDNCSVAPGTTGNARPSIEDLAQAFGNFLDNLGPPQVDVVAHSMGGLIVRAWLAGKNPQGGFSPPPVVRIRKAILIATPNAGLLSLAGLLGANITDSQTVEMFAGSSFLWDLGTWNQRMDDLRGIQSLSIAGNLGSTSGSAHTDDGVVVLTSASLATTLGASRVRVLPYCHANNLPYFLCDGPGIAVIENRSHPTYQIVTSFLLGNNTWETIGSDASQDPVLSRYGGVLLDYVDNLGNSVSNPGAAVVMNAPEQGDLPRNSEGVFFADYIPAGRYQVRLDGATYPLPVVQGGHLALEVKQGPEINLVAPAAGNVPALERAPGMLIAIYGSNLQNATVTIDGVASPVFYNSSGQINSIIPGQSEGLVQLSVANAIGQDSLNILLAPAVPALFSADRSGTGAALALHTTDSSPVTALNPAHWGEDIEIFLTGLGVPAQVPALQADGATAKILSIAPLSGSPGVIRLEFVVSEPPTGSSSIQLQAVAGTFSSNVVTLAVAP
jgi:uncharacterized protein (TIGR03437 family)